ncbi:MAG: BON domain-containing protein [Verrucomicrobium sp.]|nr:BON domain-containing protein [Verrucomicrobium sp.]
MNTSADLQHDVEAELGRDPDVHAERIGVTVIGEIVQLDGRVNTFSEKVAAESAAFRVKHVKAVANGIQVELTPSNERSDTDIAREALDQFEWGKCVPDTVRAVVSHGWVRFEGSVATEEQKDEAERVLRSLKGVKGIENEVTIQPKIDVGLMREGIKDAFERHAAIDAQNIQIATSAGHVRLSGCVRDEAEHEEAQRVAWAAPGVTAVEDLLTIQPG